VTAQPFLLPAGTWTQVYDGNGTAFDLFRRHYSFSRSKRVPESEHRIAGPGEKMLLLNADATALFVWRKFISKDAQEGVNCAVFRNESTHRSSDLIREAMRLGWERWPRTRFYTYVNPRRVRSSNPGYCFKMAGWRSCGVTKTRKLLVLECLPD
jgi:hypothetical protein